MSRIAVLMIHGIEIEDPEFAETPARLLQKHFRRHVGSGGGAEAEGALVVEAVHWAPVLEREQRELMDRAMGGKYRGFFDSLVGVVRRLNRGSQGALVPLLGMLALRNDPRVGRLNYPALRWLMMHFVGDAVAYQASPGAREVYDQVHVEVARALGRLRQRAGAEAPLCVVAHSLGSIIASNYFYDLQAERAGRGEKVSAAVRPHVGESALERGETLTWLYTLGSPMALWSLRYPQRGLELPVEVPAPEVAQQRAGLEGEWVNYYDEDDVVAWPLRTLSPAYYRAVRRDERVSLRGLPFRWTPLIHPFYWSDERVMEGLARSLARGWKHMRSMEAARGGADKGRSVA